MNRCFGYVRVSTAKQGEGVSLAQQKDAIVGYASRHNLDIIEWFEEKETAAKRARRRLGLDAIRQHCIQELEARLELPARTDDDWSIDLPGDCQCDLCTTLGTFL